MSGGTVTIHVDGTAVPAPEGALLAHVLGSRGPAIGRSPRLGAPRGMFCGMGLCFECAVTVDGGLRRSCLTPVRDGMIVSTSPGGAGPEQQTAAAAAAAKAAAAPAASAPLVTRESCDIAVIGAGPAGLSAAAEAAKAGARVICLDLYPRPGGQYAMQPGGGAPAALASSPPARLGRDLAREAGEAGARLLDNAEVFWAARDGGRFHLYAAREGGAEVLAIGARALVVAAGAMERPLAFPGWTLPGVIGAGAAQRLVKGSGTLPFGGRTVLAGTGPFLMAVASTFAGAGQKIDHLVEMQPLRPLASLGMLAAWPSRWRAATGLLRDLRRTGARRHYGHVVTRALGEQHLEAVEIAPLDAAGRPDPSRAERIGGVGALCIGYGFAPVIDVTTALGADHAHDLRLGGWHCVASDESGATSVPALYAAGETCGIGGMLPALLSGRIAGRAAARLVLGRGAVPASDAPLLAGLARARRFALGLARHWPAPQALPVPLPAGEPVCRCEDVRLCDIRDAIDAGAAENLAVKLWTRAGMGPCQGRICSATLAAILGEAGTAPARAGYNRAHFPLRPVPLASIRAALALAGGDPAAGDGGAGRGAD